MILNQQDSYDLIRLISIAVRELAVSTKNKDESLAERAKNIQSRLMQSVDENKQHKASMLIGFANSDRCPDQDRGWIRELGKLLVTPSNDDGVKLAFSIASIVGSRKTLTLLREINENLPEYQSLWEKAIESASEFGTVVSEAIRRGKMNDDRPSEAC